MIDKSITAHLNASGVAYCLIGATALSVHGFARYTADVDLLAMSEKPLEGGFWSGFLGASALLLFGAR